ncbi:MAG TPA: sugar phosphate isomerase/epimerase [Vicinamibacterales bacterium]|nr:sugar phosphate isomerase/epimerase [Vicinamibacterales bacterium]
MTTTRRTFLGQMAMSALIPAVGRAAEQKIDRLGLQLYTVRTAIEKDFEGTLAKVAAAGYQEVEFAGYFDQDPKKVRAILDRHKLSAPSAHIDYATVETKLDQALAAARVIGHRFLVNPWIDEEMRKQPDIWQRVATTFNKAGETCRKAGVQFAYHNHHFEFVPVNGVVPFDLLLKECDPNLVKMELDLCWITVARKDPLTYFERYPGRFPLVHVKGLKKIPEGQAPVAFDQAIPNITDVGTNDVVDWKRIFAKSSQAGIRHYFVEHDQPPTPFESIQTSATYLHSLRF